MLYVSVSIFSQPVGLSGVLEGTKGSGTIGEMFSKDLAVKVGCRQP